MEFSGGVDMRQTIQVIVDEALASHCDDVDLFREVLEELIHAWGQLMGEEGLSEIGVMIEKERQRINKIV